MIATDIGIDLGTSNTLVYVSHKGILINEPTLLIVSGGTKRTLRAIGADARLGARDHAGAGPVGQHGETGFQP